VLMDHCAGLRMTYSMCLTRSRMGIIRRIKRTRNKFDIVKISTAFEASKFVKGVATICLHLLVHSDR
jgi:hypothetical protein